MNVWPVIVREVRVQARQKFTYTLRMLGAAAVLGALVFWALTHGLLPGQGGHIFVYIHCTLLWAIWILVPLSTADCVSRERREGTLGLLFLTHLTARDIVFAKGLAHGLRAVTLWLAALPIIVIPFLMGGLPWQSVALSCAINFSSIVLALAASVLASSLCREWHRSLALAMMIGTLLVAAYGIVLLVGVSIGFAPSLPWLTRQRVWTEPPPLEALLTGALIMVSGADDVWAMAASRFSPLAQRGAIIALAAVTVSSLLAACGLLLIAARSVRRRWQEHSRSARMEKLERIFCTPMFWASLLRRWMRWKLNRNPIGWLEQRTWSGRLVMWSWLAVLVGFYSTVFSSGGFYLHNFQPMQVALAWLLMVSIAATAAGSFRRERESGVLELLLVSPLNSWQIIIGRVRGMWAQFAPAVALLIGVWLFVATFEHEVSGWDGMWFSVSFLTLPVIGLYYSLAKTHFLSAFVWTLLMGYLLPILLANAGMVQRMILWQLGFPAGNLARTQTAVGPIWALLQIMLAIGFGHLLHRNLEQRRFALERRPV
jgi:ABC-type transport system involved in multi-copper enzyme maturation permease subunit